jgi:transposase
VLTLPPTLRVFVHTRPTDMRRSFDGLVGQVREFLGEDPLSGHLFVFVNKNGDRVKLLWWERDGLAIYYKRLEAGTFRFGTSASGKLEMSGADLHLVLQGIDPAKVERQARYQRAS